MNRRSLGRKKYLTRFCVKKRSMREHEQSGYGVLVCMMLYVCVCMYVLHEGGEIILGVSRSIDWKVFQVKEEPVPRARTRNSIPIYTQRDSKFSACAARKIL